MTALFLADSVQKLKQISTKYSPLLEKLGIFTIKDLLTYFPVYYKDTGNISSLTFLQNYGLEKTDYTIKIKIIDFKSVYLRTRKTLQTAKISDGTGEIKSIWFNQHFLANTIKSGKEFLFFGRIKRKPKSIEFYPNVFEEIIEGREIVHLGRISPEYSLTEGITKKWFRNRVKSLSDNLKNIEIPDELHENNLSVIKLTDSLKEVHFPTVKESFETHTNNLSLSELTNIQLKILKNKEGVNIKAINSKSNFEYEKLLKGFKKDLSFKLTTDQEKIIERLGEKFKKNILINDLIQGDVGSGKTVIAVFASILANENGLQSVVLCPTTILAKQHFLTFKEILKNKKISIELVTSDNKHTTPADILIGTSAVLARKQNLIKKLGLVIVDEQHRFGVAQREELLKPVSDTFFNKEFPHFIDMTATPIPRTVALAFFEDIEVHSIKTKPMDRKVIKTFLVDEKKRENCYSWLKEKITAEKSQIYWICPLIDESEKTDLKAATAVFEKLEKEFKGFKVGLLHGRMKENEKSEILLKFKEGKIDILVSTTVIEVGIDIKNADIMAIENSERFGLAQLHQIRGRVGRGEKQSWCFLFYSEEVSEQSLGRLNFIAQNTNGQEIAEFDLSQRGPGEVYGSRQSGIPNLKIAKLNNLELIKKSKEIAKKLFAKNIKEIKLFS